MWYCRWVETRLAEHFVEQIAAVYAEVREVLDERQRRLVLGAAARRIGRGGIKQVAAAVGVVADRVTGGRPAPFTRTRPSTPGPGERRGASTGGPVRAGCGRGVGG